CSLCCVIDRHCFRLYLLVILCFYPFLSLFDVFVFLFFFFIDPATAGFYTLSLHDALPIPRLALRHHVIQVDAALLQLGRRPIARSEEHTSELQSPDHLVCRLLLEKKKKIYNKPTTKQ